MPLYREPKASNDYADDSEFLTIPLTTTPALLVAADDSTRGIKIISDIGTVFVGTKETVSAAPGNHTIDLYTGDYYEFPFSYRGDIYAVLASGTASLTIERFFKK